MYRNQLKISSYHLQMKNKGDINQKNAKFTLVF
jgi:hypothetical protein